MSTNCGVYMLFWPNTPHFYIGGSIHLNKRKCTHYSNLKRNASSNRRLQEVFNTHGKPEFKIIERCEEAALDKLEMDYIERYLNNEYLLNLNVNTTRRSSENASKNKNIFIQMNDYELTTIQRKAEQLGLNIDEFMRYAAVSFK